MEMQEGINIANIITIKAVQIEDNKITIYKAVLRSIKMEHHQNNSGVS